MDRRKFLAAAAVTAVTIAGTQTAHATGKVATHPASAVPFAVPAGACDCHVHVIGPQGTYPMLDRRAYTPPLATVQNLRDHMAMLQMSRVVLVQPSIYGTDNRCLLDALKELGAAARGIAVIGDTTLDHELHALSDAGVRGVRINLESVGLRDPDAAARSLVKLASRVAPLGWHMQLYASLEVIAVIANQVATLPVPVVFDHFAMTDPTKGVDQESLQAVLRLLQDGRAYVKLSAPYRIMKSATSFEAFGALANTLIDANAARILWASDWPHTDRAPLKASTEISPFRAVDDVAVLNLLRNWVPDNATRTRILVSNPQELFRFRAV